MEMNKKSPEKYFKWVYVFFYRCNTDVLVIIKHKEMVGKTIDTNVEMQNGK